MPPNHFPSDRSSPSSILNRIEEDERRRLRGKLKIFFGSSAGVGKTYAMLQTARQRKAEGADVVVGVVETHGRPETEALTEGLSKLPLRKINHREIALYEFDLDAALRRRPAIILIDELAHANAPESRHPKRWLDVEELLSAGIDVYTTLNVQHLESLNDVVTSITGIAVREMVPDTLFDEADDVVLVDTPPDELLKRLHDGKVYVTPGANERALQNFFRKTNLMSLRELALRRTAEYVDVDTDEERQREGLNTPNVAGDKLLVCVGADKLAAKLVRTGRRLASAFKAPWTTLFIETSDTGGSGVRIRQHLQQIMHSAGRNGARVLTLSGEGVCAEIMDYARDNGITKIIIGRPQRPAWRELFGTNLADEVIRRSGNIDVYVVTAPATPMPRRIRRIESVREMGIAYIIAVATVATLAGIGCLLKPALSNNDMALLYLMGSLPVAAWLGRWPALLYSLFSVSAFNFLFVKPPLGMGFYDHSYWLAFTVMILANLVISGQAKRAREQTAATRRHAHDTQIFYDLTRILTITRGRKAVCDAGVAHIDETLGATAAIWLPDDAGLLDIASGATQGDILKESAVAQWSFKHRQEAGFGTDTLPGASGYYTPIDGYENIIGVMGVYPRLADAPFNTDEINRIETYALLLASALERAFSSEKAEKAMLADEQERMRNVLLKSQSDLQ